MAQQRNWPPRRQRNILQGHQQTLSLHIGKGQVDAAWNEHRPWLFKLSCPYISYTSDAANMNTEKPANVAEL